MLSAAAVKVLPLLISSCNIQLLLFSPTLISFFLRLKFRIWVFRWRDLAIAKFRIVYFDIEIGYLFSNELNKFAANFHFSNKIDKNKSNNMENPNPFIHEIKSSISEFERKRRKKQEEND